MLEALRTNDYPVRRSSNERYSRIASTLDWVIVLIPASSIFLVFAVDPPSYFHFSDNVILLSALYAVAGATVMFIMPVIHDSIHYRQFDVERFLLITKEHVNIMFAMYLGLGLALNSRVPILAAYGSASLTFIFIFLRFIRHNQAISIYRIN
jgi:hypothetical protein